MSTRIIVNGAHGKMGSLACVTIQQHPDFELVAALGRSDNLEQAITTCKPNIVIDLTRADCVYTNSEIIIKCGARPLIGTSGLVEEQIIQLRKLCFEQQLGGMIVPNFSISAVLMMKFAAQAAAYITDVEIVESHHQQKLDAPSGTALKSAEMISAARKQNRNKLDIKEIIPCARGGVHHDINIHSLRIPGVLAHQKIIFGGQGETLTITHNTIDRSCFMPGLILCCQKIQQLNTLYYGLEHILS
ncbi:MAG: 4-hydroxy-tetrahydrodipicolinate reductase [Legionella sp.]